MCASYIHDSRRNASTKGHSKIVHKLFFCFLGPQQQHVEIPRLGVQLELQLLAYTTATAQIQAAFVTYTTWLGNAGSLTH